MTGDELERQIYDLVTKLWPRSKTGREEFREAVWKTKLRWRTEEEITVALQMHRRAEPDRATPKWIEVFILLRATYATGRNKLDALLDQIREHKGKLGWTEARDLTPADLFDEHLRAQTSTILFTWHGTTKGPSELRNTHRLKPLPDPHGLLRWRAAMKIGTITTRWREYHEVMGVRPPDFLMMPDEPIEHPRHADSFAAMRRELERGEAGNGMLAQTEADLRALHGSEVAARVRRKAIAREADMPVDENERAEEPLKIGGVMQSLLPDGMRDKRLGQGVAVTVEPPSPAVSNGQETMEFRRQDDRPGGEVTHG